MTLETATEGPCKGHPCDNCKLCQRGRCCRNDNPHYQLPELGDWDGPVYGELGKLRDDGDRAECHVCGQYYQHLGNHVWLSHDLTADEYKALFGLRASTGLIGPGLFAIRSRDALKHKQIEKALALRTWERVTPEQRSAQTKGRKQRLESRLDPEVQASRREANRKRGKATHERYLRGEIQFSMEHLQTPEVREKARRHSQETLARKYAEHPELKEEWKQKLSAPRTLRSGKRRGDRVIVKCPICGTEKELLAHLAKHRTTCGAKECLSELRRRNANRLQVSKRPEVRAKLSAAKRGKYPEHLRKANEERCGA